MGCSFSSALCPSEVRCERQLPRPGEDGWEVEQGREQRCCPTQAHRGRNTATQGAPRREHGTWWTSFHRTTTHRGPGVGYGKPQAGSNALTPNPLVARAATRLKVANLTNSTPAALLALAAPAGAARPSRGKRRGRGPCGTATSGPVCTAPGPALCRLRARGRRAVLLAGPQRAPHGRGTSARGGTTATGVAATRAARGARLRGGVLPQQRA